VKNGIFSAAVQAAPLLTQKTPVPASPGRVFDRQYFSLRK
jgi:hypothetical protein